MFHVRGVVGKTDQRKKTENVTVGVESYME
jgi:hypothetical protein